MTVIPFCYKASSTDITNPLPDQIIQRFDATIAATFFG